MDEGAFDACAASVRRADPDRYFSALFAPAERRPFLFALFAFNHELARIGERAREPMMGAVRLEWWRETIDGARAGAARPHDVARAMAAVLAAAPLPQDMIEAMIEARRGDLDPEPFAGAVARAAYLDATSGNLMRLAARLLGAGGSLDELAREAGLAYGLAGLLRNDASGRVGKRLIPAPDVASVAREAREHFGRARKLFPSSRGACAAVLPAALAPLYLRNPATDIPIWRRQIALLRAALRGRL